MCVKCCAAGERQFTTEWCAMRAIADSRTVCISCDSRATVDSRSAHAQMPACDSLELDSQVNTPYPTAILVREKAMVINLESIRMIICKDQVRFW